MKRAMWIAVAFWTAGAGTALPNDTIFTSTSEKAFFGKIISISSTVVNFEPQKNGPTEIPVNEITRIVFENSPQDLFDAQKYMLDGEFEKAINKLSNETTDDKRKEVAEEIIFCRAYCAVQLALSGTGDANDAGRQMFAFIKNSPNNFHYWRACERMGDLCVARDKFADARRFYAMLAQAPWPDYKILAQVALGRAYSAQGKAADADKAFDDALNTDAAGPLAEAQRAAARIGKARCMVLNDKSQAAIRSLNEVIQRSDEKHVDINAMAYNALGMAQRKAGKPKEAILSFLRVHLLFHTQPDLDAEAVAYLERLFTETHQPIKAKDMRDILDEKYGNSRWAKGVK